MSRQKWIKSNLKAGVAISTAATLGLLLATSIVSGGAGAAANKSPVRIVAVAPFSGADAGFGLHAQSGCLTAAAAINGEGGIMSHPIQCLIADTKGDPADAVAVTEKTLAFTKNLIGIIGPTSDEASAVAPMINAAHIPFFSTTGQSQFDKTNLKYFYRLVPPDAFAGAAMALWANSRHYKRVAILVGNDIGSQGTVPSIISSLAKLGSPKIVLNQTISLDATSYNTEVTQLIQAKPQAILTEVDPQTAATYFSELQQQLGTAPFPELIGANPILVPEWYTAVSTAIGATLTQQNVLAENSTAVTGGPAWQKFDVAINTAAKTQPTVAKYSTNATVEREYDAVNLIALAAIKTHSLDPVVINKAILGLANGVPGAKSAIDFATGKRLLASGKLLRYVGLTGPTYLNSHHNALGGFVMQQFTSDGNVTSVKGSNLILNQAALAKLS